MATDLVSSLASLTHRERLYVKARLEGLKQTAAAAAAGCPDPARNGYDLERREQVQQAMIVAMQELADDVQFSRKEAHDMLMQAYQNADSAAEQIMAVRELIKLHGVEAPKVIKHEHEHNHHLALEHMDTKELMKIAGMEDLAIDAEYTVVEEDAPRLEHSKDSEDARTG